jgi:hypothetical protein
MKTIPNNSLSDYLNRTDMLHFFLDSFKENNQYPDAIYNGNRFNWLMEYLNKYNLSDILLKMEETKLFRENNPDWDRPVVMYGIRKMGHKCIKKKEIAVVIDKMPYQDRARMAETHWYKIIYKRPATDIEWKEVSDESHTRRYVVYRYFIEKNWTVDKIVSNIIQDDKEEYSIPDTDNIIQAFENFYDRKIRIYRRETTKQLKLFE